jgi:hypothetical protein
MRAKQATVLGWLLNILFIFFDFRVFHTQIYIVFTQEGGKVCTSSTKKIGGRERDGEGRREKRER